MEFGRIDIFTEVAVMSQYSSSPRLGHIEGLCDMFEYLKKHEMSRVLFDPFQPKDEENEFALGTMDWKSFYGDIEETTFLRGCQSHWVRLHTQR